MLVGHLFRHFIFSKRAGALIRRIAFLSIGGITVSVTAFLVVLFVMNGMNASIRKRILGLEPHLYVTVPGVQNAMGLETHPVYSRIKEDPTTQAYVYETQDVILRSQDGQFRGAFARGVTRQSLEYFISELARLDAEKPQNARGGPPSYVWDPQDVPDEGEVVLGVDLAASLGVFDGDFITVVSPTGLLLPPGQTPKFERVRVKRVVTTALPDVDAQFLFYQRGKALKALGSGDLKKLGIEMWLADDSRVDTVKNDLMKFSDVQVETWMERNSALFYALKLEKLTIGVFLGLAGMIAASSILTVLALLLSQKRRDIAVLRTIGLSGKQTVKIFTQIGFLLAGSGVLMGVVIGTGVSLYIQNNPLTMWSSQTFYDTTIPSLVDWWLVFGVLLVSSLIALLGSYIPARTATDVQPSEALRMK
ncbi:FtsX-like permease family protein [Bdellovibrio sp. HCB274]|uniref:FtsX-like permease family protein n=1 Tax=Bdellovibrio sp. HCB274 TaxID=3394361 RepID=UPI0039B4D32D